MSGKVIVLEGLDGSGKATQAEYLAKAMTKKGKDVMQVSFPDYESNSSALVKMYLGGEFGADPADVNAYAASSFFAVDRYASYKKNWGQFYEQGGMIICDRYTTSNAVHQCAKMPEDQWDGFLDWLFHYEYEKLGLPAPDEVIYLRTSPEAGQQLMAERYEGEDSRKDIHENNVDYQALSRKAADYCAKKLGWKVIECIRNGQIRSVEEIHHEIMWLIG